MCPKIETFRCGLNGWEEVKVPGTQHQTDNASSPKFHRASVFFNQAFDNSFKQL